MTEKEAALQAAENRQIGKSVSSNVAVNQRSQGRKLKVLSAIQADSRQVHLRRHGAFSTSARRPCPASMPGYNFFPWRRVASFSLPSFYLFLQSHEAEMNTDYPLPAVTSLPLGWEEVKHASRQSTPRSGMGTEAAGAARADRRRSLGESFSSVLSEGDSADVAQGDVGEQLFYVHQLRERMSKEQIEMRSLIRFVVLAACVSMNVSVACFDCRCINYGLPFAIKRQHGSLAVGLLVFVFFAAIHVSMQRAGGLSNGCGCSGCQADSPGETAGSSLAGQETSPRSRLR